MSTETHDTYAGNNALLDDTLLNDTLPSRITQAVGAGLFMAVPDYVDSRPLRWLVRGGIAAGTVGLVAYFNSIDDDPNNDPAIIMDRVKQRVGDLGFGDGPESDDVIGDFDSPLKTWGILGAGAIGVATVLKVSGAVNKVLAGGLRKVGVGRPHTALGVLTGSAVFALSGRER
ncbi:hypothetical protein [Corynebacterium durum]|uniref:hypothetical protein n=1 Tax=Corynebacterium durum TaxID=61592 RepID=UPI0028899284|nr:hypothetical protein [Corynebacterium durum]